MSEIAALPCRPDAVIFDMDGLMIDSERVSIACWSEASAAMGIALPDGFFLQMVGLGDRDCERLLLQHVDEARIASLFSNCHDLYEARTQAGLPLRPGILELLDLLKTHGVPRAVATSTRQPRANRKLGASGLLPYFDAVVTSSDVQHPKPAPDIYLLAAQRLGKDPARCLALEDSPAGTRAAVAAGMTAIQVPDLVHPDDSLRALGHRIVDSLHDVRALLVPWLAAAR
ncbi:MULTISPECIES: HAD-IA family hydrolase [unclassified Stenotrophomonas]|uniref:HAD-IA family hydrolase n=1 Tax=unclassified Stenotrophomonas TaxID=196198 RepID=UPI00177B80BC|nr:HAD family phosphatase [Stenotrophomonas sp. CFBP 13725]MBD8697808.1 HAD family phosphatase [Stenotrophomonas sp. CFBP 13718]